jgi:hypothetical protein
MRVIRVIGVMRDIRFVVALQITTGEVIRG